MSATMNEFEQLLMEEEKSLKSIRTGDTVEGVVFDVKPDEIILNIGSKSDGILTRNEYTNEPGVDLTTVVKVGETMTVKVVKVNDGYARNFLIARGLAVATTAKSLEILAEQKEQEHEEEMKRKAEAEALAEGDGSILFFGMLQSGTSHNIVASTAFMKGTLRTYFPKTREKVLTKLEEIAAQTADAYGTEVEVIYSSFAPAVINPEGLTHEVQKLLPNVVTEIEPTRIAEDFSRYQEVAPGVLMWLGVGDTPNLHNGKFLVPKEVLPLGVDAWIRLAEHKW